MVHIAGPDETESVCKILDIQCEKARIYLEDIRVDGVIMMYRILKMLKDLE